MIGTIRWFSNDYNLLNKTGEGRKSEIWTVTSKSIDTGKIKNEVFDYVIICTGYV
jgi:hypothetical protein